MHIADQRVRETGGNFANNFDPLSRAAVSLGVDGDPRQLAGQLSQEIKAHIPNSFEEKNVNHAEMISHQMEVEQGISQKLYAQDKAKEVNEIAKPASEILDLDKDEIRMGIENIYGRSEDSHTEIDSLVNDVEADNEQFSLAA